MELLSDINNTTKLYKIKLRTLIQKFSSWNENRSINDKKVEEIYTAYENKDIALLTSQFRGVMDNDNWFLLDGHHRKEAAVKLLTKFPKFDEDLFAFIVVHIKNGMNNQEIYDLHIKSNLCEPLKPNQIPHEKRTLLINEIINHRIFRNGISKTNGSKIAYSYKLSLNEVAELSGDILLKYPNLEIELILYDMSIINNRISLLFINDNLPFLFKNGKIKKDVIDICGKHNLYLNIKDSIYNKEVWINYIEKPNLIDEVLNKIKES